MFPLLSSWWFHKVPNDRKIENEQRIKTAQNVSYGYKIA